MLTSELWARHVVEPFYAEIPDREEVRTFVSALITAFRRIRRR
ncbi:hypothetical protein [Saccharopolyspora sp. NPDC002578]